MISKDDMRIVAQLLSDQAEGCMWKAQDNKNNDFLCGSFDGLEDSLYTAMYFIETQKEVRSIDEFIALYQSIRNSSSISYHQSSDFLKELERGRCLGGKLALALLEAFAPEDWVENAKKEK